MSRSGGIAARGCLCLKLMAEYLSGAVGYQWSKNGVPISGATSDTYHVDAFTANDAGACTCELSGGTFGVAGPVQIAVTPPKMSAAGPAGLALAVAMAATVLLILWRGKSPYQGH